MSDQIDYQSFQTVQVGDVGVSLIVSILDPDDVIVDLQAATTKIIRLGFPDSTSKDFAASFLTDGSDGKLVYKTLDGDITKAGCHQVQGIVTIGGETRSSTVSAFNALENIPTPP